MKYVLEIDMESDDAPTQDQLIEAVKAAAEKLPGTGNYWTLRGAKPNKI